MNLTTTIALLGGNEFHDGCRVADSTILELTGQERPNIKILPTANIHHPDIAADNGVQYFSDLGFNSTKLMITNREAANNPENASELSSCDLLYLPGGSPQYLFECLYNTCLVEEIIKRASQGMIIAGSSAGAMVMGELLKNPPQGTWGKGLGLISNFGVIPHHENADHQKTFEELKEVVFSDHPEAIICGISIESGCIVQGSKISVIGNSDLILYRSSGYSKYRFDQSLSL